MHKSTINFGCLQSIILTKALFKFFGFVGNSLFTTFVFGVWFIMKTSVAAIHRTMSVHFECFSLLSCRIFFVQNSMFIARNSLNSWRKFISSIYDYCYLSNGFKNKLVVIQQLVSYCVCVFAYLFVLLLRCVDFALFSSHSESIMMANFMVDIYMSLFIFPYMNFVFRVHYLYFCSRKKREYGR